MLQTLSFQIDNFFCHFESVPDAISLFPAAVEIPTPLEYFLLP